MYYSASGTRIPVNDGWSTTMKQLPSFLVVASSPCEALGKAQELLCDESYHVEATVIDETTGQAKLMSSANKITTHVIVVCLGTEPR